MPTLRKLSPEELEHLEAQGIDTEAIAQQNFQIMEPGEAKTYLADQANQQAGAFKGGVLPTARNSAGALIAGGLAGTAGWAAAAEMAPVTGGLSFLVPAVAAAVTGVIGSKAGDIIQKKIVEPSVLRMTPEEQATEEMNAQLARKNHPIASIATDVIGGALAGGGSPNLKAPVYAAKGIAQWLESGAKTGIENQVYKQAVGNVITGNALNTAINTGVQLATTGKVDPTELAASAIGGALFTDPSALGRKLNPKWTPLAKLQGVPTQDARTPITVEESLDPGNPMNVADVEAYKKTAKRQTDEITSANADFIAKRDAAAQHAENLVNEQMAAHQAQQKDANDYLTQNWRTVGSDGNPVIDNKAVKVEFKRRYREDISGITDPVQKALAKTRNEQLQKVPTDQMREALYWDDLHAKNPEAYEQQRGQEQADIEQRNLIEQQNQDAIVRKAQDMKDALTRAQQEEAQKKIDAERQAKADAESAQRAADYPKAVAERSTQEAKEKEQQGIREAAAKIRPGTAVDRPETRPNVVEPATPHEGPALEPNALVDEQGNVRVKGINAANVFDHFHVTDRFAHVSPDGKVTILKDIGHEGLGNEARFINLKDNASQENPFQRRPTLAEHEASQPVEEPIESDLEHRQTEDRLSGRDRSRYQAAGDEPQTQSEKENQRLLGEAGKMATEVGDIKGKLKDPTGEDAAGVSFDPRQVGRRLIGIASQHATSDTGYHELVHAMIRDLKNSGNPDAVAYARELETRFGGEEPLAEQTGKRYQKTVDKMAEAGLPTRMAEYVKNVWANMKVALGSASNAEAERNLVAKMRNRAGLDSSLLRVDMNPHTGEEVINHAGDEPIGSGSRNQLQRKYETEAGSTKVEPDGFIHNFGIKKSQRGQGEGSRLLEKVIADGDEAKIPLSLQVHKDNEAAVSLYEKHGFVNKGEPDEFGYQDMERPVGAPVKETTEPATATERNINPDVQEYARLTKTFATSKGPAKYDAWQQLENLKNKYGGMPPKHPEDGNRYQAAKKPYSEHENYDDTTDYKAGDSGNYWIDPHGEVIPVRGHVPFAREVLGENPHEQTSNVNPYEELFKKGWTRMVASKNSVWLDTGEGHPLKSSVAREAKDWAIENGRNQVVHDTTKFGDNGHTLWERELAADDDGTRYQAAKRETAPARDEIPEPSKRGFLSRMHDLTRSAVERIRADIPTPEGNRVADALQKTLSERQNLLGRWLNPVLEVARKMTPAQLERVDSALYAEVNDKSSHQTMLRSQAERELYKTIRKAYIDNYEYRKEINEPIIRNGKATAPQSDPFYHATTTNPQIADLFRQNSDKAKIKSLTAEFLQHQLDHGYTEHEAQENFEHWQEAIQGSAQNNSTGDQTNFNAARKAQGIPLPDSFRRKDLMRNMEAYFRRQAADNSYYHNIESVPDVAGLLGYKKNPWGDDNTVPENGRISGHDSVKGVIRELKGGYIDSQSRRQHAFESLSTALMLGPLTETHKTFSTIAQSLSQFANPLDAARGLVHAVTHLGEAWAHTKETGYSQYDAKKLDDMFNTHLTAAERIQGLTKTVREIYTVGGLTERFTKSFSQATGEYLLPAKIELANKGDATAQRLMRYLDPEWSKGKSYKGDDLVKLSSEFANMIHGSKDARTLPAWMLNDNEISAFFKLSSWNIAQTNNWVRNVWKPMTKDGNYGPMLMSILGAGLGGAVIKELREKLAGRRSPIPTFQEIAASEKGMSGNLPAVAYNLMSMASLAGFAGIVSNVAKYPLDSMFRNEWSGATFPLDEAVSSTAKIVRQVAEALAYDPNANILQIAPRALADWTKENVQLIRIAANQAADHGVLDTGVLGEPGREYAYKKRLSDKEGELRRFKMVSRLPYESQAEVGGSPYVNLEQRQFKREEDPAEAIKQLPGLVTNIIKNYGDNPEVMLQKFRGLKENSYQTMPSPEDAPMAFYKYLKFLRARDGVEAASERMLDYLKHRMVNEAKASVVP